MTSTQKIAIVLTLFAGGLVALLMLSGAGDAMTYSKLVDEVVQHPERYRDRQLRVEGMLAQGSIRFREEPCEWRFVVEKNGRSMPVRFPECVVPDTFRDGFGVSVTVLGELQENGTFLATEVIPRCPSKYEMQQRANRGEHMPHTMPATPPSFEDEAAPAAPTPPEGTLPAPTPVPAGAAVAPSEPG